MPQRVVVPAADFIRNIGHWQKEALRHPISITHFGKERLILASPEDLDAREPVEQTAIGDGPWRVGYSLLIDNMLQGYVAFDAQQRIVLVNRVSEAFLGAGRDELLGQTLAGAFPDVVASVLGERIHAVLRSRMPVTFEVGVSGGPYISGVAFPCAENVIVVFSNETELYALQHMREENEALKASVAAHARVTTMKLDARARIEAVSGSFSHWSGFDPEHVVGHRLYDLVVSRERRDVAQAFETVLRLGRPRHMPLSFLSKSGNEVSGAVSFAAVMTDFVPRGASVVWVTDSMDAGSAYGSGIGAAAS